MLHKKITRKEFCKAGILGIVAAFIFPAFKIFDSGKDTGHKYKEAGYYRNLAG